MKKHMLVFSLAISIFLASKPAVAQGRVIVRTTVGMIGLNVACSLAGCAVTQSLDGSLGQLYAVTGSNGASVTDLIEDLLAIPGIVDAEPDQLVKVNQSKSPAAPPGLWDTTPVNYYGTVVWDGYLRQPAIHIISLSSARSAFKVTGAGVVGMIDTGVDPNQPVLRNVLLQGYDFTRNQPGGSEMSDVNQSTMAVVNQSNPAVVNHSGAAPAQVNQSTMAVVNQQAAAEFQQPQYADFGHGTMTAGIVHLVAPTVQILPLKAFGSNGTGYLSNVIWAVYWGTQHGSNVLNMSFDFTIYSYEMAQAINYAAVNGVVSVASVGNNGEKMMVYPAGLKNVMGVASTSDQDTLSTFSNFGAPPVWVAAPGEAIISTYPFATYAAGWGTSFSAPFVSGTVALLRSLDLPLMQSVNSGLNQPTAAQAISRAQDACGNQCGYGVLDVFDAMDFWGDDDLGR